MARAGAMTEYPPALARSRLWWKGASDSACRRSDGGVRWSIGKPIPWIRDVRGWGSSDGGPRRQPSDHSILLRREEWSLFFKDECLPSRGEDGLTCVQVGRGKRDDAGGGDGNMRLERKRSVVDASSLIRQRTSYPSPLAHRETPSGLEKRSDRYLKQPFL